MDEISSIEQLEKRIEWLDNERRNDKTNLASLQNRLSVLETENISLRQQLKELDLNLSKLGSQLGNLDKYDSRIERVNNDLTKQIRDVNERADMNLSEAVKRTKLEIDSNRKSISELYPLFDALEPIRTDIKNNKTEDARLARLIEDLKGKILDVSRFDEDYRRSLQLLEENRRQEAKRITDLQGESVSLRKRLEETRSRQDSHSDSYRQLDTRISELMKFEKDRKESQTTFIDRVNNTLLDKDKTFSTWEKRFAEIDNINLSLTSQLEELDKAKKAVDKSINGADEAMARIDRRINEITEIQRLNDERFRQEWNAFKSDDVKRWTNYMLGHEENQRSLNQQISSAASQLETLVEDNQKSRDELERLSRETARHIQAILMAYQESFRNISAFVELKSK